MRVPDAFPSYRIRARNLARYSANRIHDDQVARTYGYQAGLVSGVTLYAYLTYPLVAAWGCDWLARGTARVAFVRPVYDGEDVTVRARVAGRADNGTAGEIAVEVTLDTARGEAAVTAFAGLAWGGPAVVPDAARYPARPLPAARPAASSESLAGLDFLGSPALALDRDELARYVEEVEDPLDLYRGPEAVAHPGLLLQQANRALSENVALGPWVHLASDLGGCGVARVGERLETRGRVCRVYERKGHRLVDLDVLVVAAGARPVLHVRHTAIYELRKGGESG